MALKNASNNYFKIGKVVGFNSVDSTLSINIEEYKDPATRNSLSEYDNVILHKVDILLDSVDVQAFVTKIYEKVKLQEPYDSMTDVVE